MRIPLHGTAVGILVTDCRFTSAILASRSLGRLAAIRGTAAARALEHLVALRNAETIPLDITAPGVLLTHFGLTRTAITSGPSLRQTARGLHGAFLAELRREVLVQRSIAIIVHAVTGGVAESRGSGRAGVHDGPGITRPLAHCPAGADAALCRTDGEVLVHGAVAVIVHVVAIRIHHVVRLTGSAVVEDLPFDAAREPTGRAHTLATAGLHREVILIRLPITVVIDAIAERVRFRWLRGAARVEELAVLTGDLAGGHALPCRSAGRLGAYEVIVGLAVTVVIHPITLVIDGGEGSPGSAGVQRDSLDAVRDSDSAADTLAAARHDREIILIHRAVAVVIHSITRRVRWRRGRRIARVEDRARHTDQLARGHALSDRSAARGCERVVLIGLTIAIIVHSITLVIDGGEGRVRSAAVGDHPVQAAGHARSDTGASTASGGLRLVVFIDHPVTIIILTVARCIG